MSTPAEERPVGDEPAAVKLPGSERSPWFEFARRILAALGVLVFVALVVWVFRDGYTDTQDLPSGRVDLVDAFYYATVSLSTAGFGDIVPVTTWARMLNSFVVTLGQVIFLVLTIGGTFQVLAEQGREMLQVSRWRKRMTDHVIVVGFGVKGRSAVDTLLTNGWEKSRIVVVDPDEQAQYEANEQGLVVVAGSASERNVLRRAKIEEARQVIITTNRDDTNVLATLTARQLNPDTWIVAAVREHQNAPLMRQSGANSVVTSSDAVGRLLGLSTLSPTLGSVMEDLLSYGQGLEVAERELLVSEVGQQPQALPDQVIAVVRDEQVHRYFDPVVSQLARGDRLIVVRPAKEMPWAPRPGTHGEESPGEEPAEDEEESAEDAASQA